jgi:hypothetical protein
MFAKFGRFLFVVAFFVPIALNNVWIHGRGGWRQTLIDAKEFICKGLDV